MIGAIHHAALRVADLAEAQARWSRLLGLTGERENDHALLRCAYEDYSLVLIPSNEPPGVAYVAYELALGYSMDDARARLRAHGVDFQEFEAHRRGMGIRTQDIDGNGVAIVARPTAVDSRPAEIRFTTTLPACHPRKFGHCNYLTGNGKRLSGWYIDVLGFKLTDRIGDEGIWLHVNADHHVIAFVEKGYNHIHHLAFELVDWGELRVALDHLAQHGRYLVWGPGRHGMARNLFSYWRMYEEEVIIELFADIQQLAPDHQPGNYPDDAHSSNAWGILPPRSYFRFDKEAIHAELHQLEAYAEQQAATT